MLSFPRAMLAFILVLSWGTTALAVQDGDRESSPQTEFVVIEISMLGADPIEVGVKVGEVATYENFSEGVRLGLRPVHVDLVNDTAEIEVVSLEGSAGQYKGSLLLSSMQMKLGMTQVDSAVGVPIDLRIKKMWKSVAEASMASRKSGDLVSICGAFTAELETAGCCVTCGGIQTCGCYVGTSCGPCCGCTSCE